MPWLDELNTSTRVHIVPGVVDNVFKNDPLLASLRANRVKRFAGGTKIRENFLYGVMGGGAYAKGDTFPMTRRQTVTGADFDPKLYYVPVVEYKEDIQIFNKGEEAVFRIIDVDLQVAALTMSARLAVAQYNEGQTAARLLQLNGFAEQLNDGVSNSWTAATYTTYGGVTRGGTIGDALSSPMGSAQVSGPVTYKLLEESYNELVIGPEHPDVIVTTNLGNSYIKEKFQPQWRTESVDPRTGFNSIVFNGARIFQSQYAPGSKGKNDADLGNYLLSTGETLWMFNTKYITFWVTDDPEFGFGFTGFKPAQDNTQVAGQYLFAGNITNQAPRFHRHHYDITG